jgi:hypothetical protein
MYIKKMIWFKVQLELLGVLDAYANEAVKDLQEDLNLRYHLKNPTVSWEGNNQRIIVHVETESLMDEEARDQSMVEAGDQMAEELLESASGALRGFNSISVNVLAVEC